MVRNYQKGTKMVNIHQTINSKFRNSVFKSIYVSGGIRLAYVPPDCTFLETVWKI